MGVGQPSGYEPHTSPPPFLGPVESSIYCAIGPEGKGVLSVSGSHRPPLLSSLAVSGLGAGRKSSQALEAIRKGDCTPQNCSWSRTCGLLAPRPTDPSHNRGLPISLGRASPAPAVVRHCLSPGDPQSSGVLLKLGITLGLVPKLHVPCG